MTVYMFTVTGMHCASCGLLIDEALEDELPGVRRSKTLVRAGRTAVHTGETVTPQAITAAIANAGYHATLEAAS